MSSVPLLQVFYFSKHLGSVLNWYLVFAQKHGHDNFILYNAKLGHLIQFAVQPKHLMKNLGSQRLCDINPKIDTFFKPWSENNQEVFCTNSP